MTTELLVASLSSVASFVMVFVTFFNNNRRFGDLNNRFNTYDKRFEDLRGLIEGLRTTVDKQLGSYDFRFNDAKHQTAEFRSALDRQLADLNSRISDLRASSDTRIGDLKSATEKGNADTREILTQKIEITNQKLENVKTELVSLTSLVSKNSSENRELTREEIRRLQGDVAQRLESARLDILTSTTTKLEDLAHKDRSAVREGTERMQSALDDRFAQVMQLVRDEQGKVLKLERLVIEALAGRNPPGGQDAA